MALPLGCAGRTVDSPDRSEAQPHSADPLSYRSLLEARGILDASLAAHTRSAEVNGDLSVAYHGVYLNEGHYSTPGEIKEYPVAGTIVRSRSLQAAVHRWEIDGMKLSEFCNRGRFVVLVNGTEQALESPETEATRCRAVDSMLPSEILIDAGQRGATLRRIGEDTIDGAPADVIAYADEFGTQHSLYIDQQTRLLVRAEHLEAHGQLGDVLVWVTFSGYQEHDGEMFPTHRVERRVERDSAATVKLTFDPPHRNTEPNPAVFSPPSGVREPADWVLSADSAPAAEIVEIGDDLFIIELPNEDFKLPFAVFDEYIIAMDAPLSSSAGEYIIDTIKAHSPGKPIRYLLLSHHHPHYVGGVRAFIHEGAALVTTQGNVDFLGDYATQRRSIKPDRLAREPREPVFEVVGDQHVFEDAHHRIEIYDIGAWTDHTKEYLVYYLPEAKLLIEGDLTWFPATGEVRAASPRTVGLVEAVRSLNLDVESILQTWPLEGQPRVGAMTTLEAMVDKAQH